MLAAKQIFIFIKTAHGGFKNRAVTEGLAFYGRHFLVGHNELIAFKREIVHHLPAVGGVKYAPRGVIYFNIKIKLFIYFR